MDYKDRYKNESPKVREMMNLIIDNCEILDSYVPQLDLIAINYELMFNAIDNIKANGYETKDNYGRIIKNHAIQQFNSSQGTIIKLLGQFPTNPVTKAKLDKLISDDDELNPLDEFMS